MHGHGVPHPVSVYVGNRCTIQVDPMIHPLSGIIHTLVAIRM